MVISSTGLRALGLPDTSGKAWDAIRNGPVNSQFSTKLGGVEFKDGSHTLLGLHANALITFDLNELPPFHTAKDHAQKTLRGSVGYFGQTPKQGASAFILIDGRILFQRDQFGRDDGLQAIDLPIPAEARFLTLVATDNGNDISHDQVCFADLRIEPAGSIDKRDTTAEQTQVASMRQQLDALSKRLSEVGEGEQVYGVVSEIPRRSFC